MKRGKQLSVNEWIELFKHYKDYLSHNITKKEFYYIYSKIRNSGDSLPS
ncbi:IS3 family transposase, partial [Mycoplasma mycoides]|nr:IS3 family transposase [Mycoplasma mycoides]